MCIAILIGCGGSTTKDGIEMKDGEGSNFTVSENEVVSEDGTKGFKGDLENTDLQTIYEGLVFENIQLIDGDDKKIDGKEVTYGSKFSIVVIGIKNYNTVNGKVFPKLSLIVTGDKGPVINEENLLDSYKQGLSIEDASVLRGTVTVGSPMEIGKQYMCVLTIKDVNNSQFYIESNWMFTVK